MDVYTACESRWLSSHSRNPGPVGPFILLSWSWDSQKSQRIFKWPHLSLYDVTLWVHEWTVIMVCKLVSYTLPCPQQFLWWLKWLSKYNRLYLGIYRREKKSLLIKFKYVLNAYYMTNAVSQSIAAWLKLKFYLNCGESFANIHYKYKCQCVPFCRHPREAFGLACTWTLVCSIPFSISHLEHVHSEA